MKSRVLVIEDEFAAREALVSLLSEEGFVVRGAPNGRTGIASFCEFHPDVVVCDYLLPDLNGLQVLRQIRAAGADTFRFILLTSGVGDPENEAALRVEADGFLGKPVDLAQLQTALAPTAV
ncbi:MAG TPA: response regulator [Longimicrobiaceae bacterium]|nr:response regulator [Longimicrobiaceae bacterium]